MLARGGCVKVSISDLALTMCAVFDKYPAPRARGYLVAAHLQVLTASLFVIRTARRFSEDPLR